MPRSHWRWILLLMVLAVPALGMGAAAGQGVETLNVRLDPLVASAIQDRNRFAVNIPHTLSSATQGQWSVSGSLSTWTYSARIASAVSMSFHAPNLTLPASAALTVSVGTHSTTYHAKDVTRGGLWSRPLPGNTLNLTLTVSTAEAHQAQLVIDSLQAGYRDLAQSPSASCSQNYSCDATAANAGPAKATVALLVANQFQCTGTLLNNTRGDGTPYILTARHCQTGKLGGGDPAAAESIVVYWDAVTPCGSALASIYEDSTTQTGAVTVVEQQDAWLIRLDDPPAAADAYYAGWDASGAAFSGGYSIHHSLGADKQYVSWYGPALLQHISASSLQVGYNSTFWGVVNQSGDVGAGSSGGALFDANNQLIGSGTLANLINGSGSAGVCPATPVAAASNSNVAAQYTALSDVWTSTADSTSTTGGATLQSVLDPENTGGLATQGFGLTPINLSADHDNPAIGATVTLSWNAPNAGSCTATGGAYGDGWAGTYGSSGSVQVTGQTPGSTTYALSCSIGNMQNRGSITVYWYFESAAAEGTGDTPNNTSTTSTSTVSTSITTTTTTAPSTAAATSSSATASTHGGGAFDPLWLLLLSIALAIRLAHRTWLKAPAGRWSLQHGRLARRETVRQ